MTPMQWKTKLEPELMEVHGVLSVELGKAGLVVNIMRSNEKRKEQIYNVFEQLAPDLPFCIKPLR